MYGGVVQTFSKSGGGDLSGYIPVSGTIPTKSVSGTIKFLNDIKVASETQPLNFIQLYKNASPTNHPMVFQSNEEMEFIAGVNGFSQIRMHTFDNGSQFYIQSGTGGILGYSINQVLFVVNDSAGKSSTLTMNPAFVNLEAHGSNTSMGFSSDNDMSFYAGSALTMRGGDQNVNLRLQHNDNLASIDLANTGQLYLGGSQIVNMYSQDTTAGGTGTVTVYPGVVTLSTDNGAGKVGSLSMALGNMTYLSTYATNQMNLFSMQPFTMDLNVKKDNTNFCNLHADPTVFSISSQNAGVASLYKFDSTGLLFTTAGTGLKISEGANARMGRTTLVGGTKTVNTNKVTATSEIFLTAQSTGGLTGELTITARTAGTSFTITSANGLDTRQVAWLIIEPLP